MSYSDKDINKITTTEFSRYVTEQDNGEIYQVILTHGSYRTGFSQHFLTVPLEKKEQIRKILQKKGFVFV